MLESDPDNHETRLQLAQALFQHGRSDDAISAALLVMRKDSAFNDGAAKALLLQFFEALGPDSASTRSGRSRMANLLFV